MTIYVSGYRISEQNPGPATNQMASNKKSRGFLPCLFLAGTLPQALSQNGNPATAPTQD